MSSVNRSTVLAAKLSGLCGMIRERADLYVEGRLLRIVGMTLEASGFRAAVGSTCLVATQNQTWLETAVVGFSENKILLMSKDTLVGVVAGARVRPRVGSDTVPVGPSLLGRVLDGRGLPFDGKPEINEKEHYPLHSMPLNPMQRAPIVEPLDVGVQAINAILTVGLGQRIGLFAGSGVGKSVLLGMMTRYTAADIVVVGLIGERGREVQEFIEHTLGPEGMQRAVVVAVPADYSPLLRMQGAMLATTIAEYFREQGKNVLLLMDSLTRYAQAQREVALSIGEPPATKGYTPSVFAKLAQLVERAGNGRKGGGSITAFYTVLTEGDDQQDPVADAARAILDGHIVLSREIAASGLYPAIDIEISISRVMTQVTSHEQQMAIQKFRQLYSKYQQYKDLINIGAYVRGSDPLLDRAITAMPFLIDFLKQDLDEAHSFEASVQTLIELARQWGRDEQTGEAIGAITHAR